MRLSTLVPDQLTAAQRSAYEAFTKQTESDSYAGFESERPDGAFLGPWGVLIHFPEVALGFGNFVDAVQEMGGLSADVRQVVVLAVGGRLNSAYELYAHSAVAAETGLTRGQIAILCAGGTPADLSTEQALAAEVTKALLRGGALAAPTYDAAVATLGQDALDTIVFTTIQYLAICTILNAYDVAPAAPTAWLDNAAPGSATTGAEAPDA